jgi:hypothetical protein
MGPQHESQSLLVVVVNAARVDMIVETNPLTGQTGLTLKVNVLQHFHISTCYGVNHLAASPPSLYFGF